MIWHGIPLLTIGKGGGRGGIDNTSDSPPGIETGPLGAGRPAPLGRARRAAEVIPATAASAIRPPRTARCLWQPAPRSCARHAEPWCDRARQSGGRFQAASAGSASSPGTSPPVLVEPRLQYGATTTGRSG